ncbi:hypothetical protein ACGFIX_14130 [Nocardia salmonicida]|uniref:hypothetical protein n=1 Tax=Nocardia salmonicida TaxID=53431 RepID=UPI003711AA73
MAGKAIKDGQVTGGRFADRAQLQPVGQQVHTAATAAADGIGHGIGRRNNQIGAFEEGTDAGLGPNLQLVQGLPGGAVARGRSVVGGGEEEGGGGAEIFRFDETV